MATGMVDNWVNVDALGPIYPFVGTETLLAILGIAFWIIWHIWQIKGENVEFKKDLEKINQRGGVGNVLDEESKRELSDMTGG
ncbi:MAG: hypothetical protein ACR2QW_07635 [bacterium]